MRGTAPRRRTSGGGRAASGNITLSSTGAVAEGMAFRVCATDMSVADVTVELEEASTYKEIGTEVKRRSL